jgi:hypothetical protein
MQYMLLIYGAESLWDGLTPEKLAEEMGAFRAYSEELVKAGKMVGGHQLQPEATAKSISLLNGKRRVLDGPYVEIKEALGGYYLINAESLEEAMQWAEKCPGARYGGIEVRPLVPM